MYGFWGYKDLHLEVIDNDHRIIIFYKRDNKCFLRFEFVKRDKTKAISYIDNENEIEREYHDNKIIIYDLSYKNKEDKIRYESNTESLYISQFGDCTSMVSFTKSEKSRLFRSNDVEFHTKDISRDDTYSLLNCIGGEKYKIFLIMGNKKCTITFNPKELEKTSLLSLISDI